MTALDRADEACIVLRKALNVIPAAGRDSNNNNNNNDGGGGGGGDDKSSSASSSSDAAAFASALRRAAARLPLSYVCDHWARAIADAESPSPYATSARDGKLLKPVRPASIRMTSTELSRTLLDAAIGHEVRSEAPEGWG